MTPDKMATTDKMGGGAQTPDATDGIEWGTGLAKAGRTRISSRLAISAPAGLAVVLLAGAVTFGHTSGFFAQLPELNGGTGSVALDDEKPEASAKADRMAYRSPKPESTEKPKAASTPKPT